ncbi:hypothetical protein [Bradyrhizobium sp. SZCCHNRI1009]|uniref:hypothetical protein n=1 Tax=Bradyrhizobium sp. SZCCHNRI1009 TaxID=3057277 RepID=UPI002916E846|nr:hypothetical protein [Bradyrhizobium sp. SZCCHNRI1009]
MLSLVKELMAFLVSTVEQQGLAVRGTVVEGRRTRRLIIELCRGPEIRLEAEFGFHIQKRGALHVTWTTWFRWPKPEEMLRDLRPPSPYDGPDVPEIRKARTQLYAIAGLRPVNDHKSNHVYFFPPEADAVRCHLVDVVDTLLQKVLPDFQPYCDVDIFSRAAMEPMAKSRLEMMQINVAAILAAAGKRREFEAWREACRNGFVGPGRRNATGTQASAVAYQEKYMLALESRLLDSD